MDKKYAVLNKKLNKLNRTNKYLHESEQKHKFSQRVLNLSPVVFNTDEIALLSKGLQYNLTYTNNSQWLENLVMETEAAITRLLILDQEGFRYLARHNIDKIINKKSNVNDDNKKEYKCLKSIKHKLLDNYLVITRGDKGKTVVIISKEELDNKVLFFNTENGLNKLKKDPTVKFQKNVKEVLKKCRIIINSSNKYKFIQIKPQAPKLNALIKLHKENLPIRPVVNYKNAPTYYTAKFLAKWLKQNLDLPYKYNINSTIHCAESLKKLNILPTSKIITLDITNLYTNIPSNETIELVYHKLQEINPDSVKLHNEINELLKVTIYQNYFESSNTIWQQENGTPMGSPISSILAEIFLQNLENIWYPNMINKRHIQYIGRYVDDVLIVYDSALATANDILRDHNEMHPNIKYNMEIEEKDYISYLDLNLHRNLNNIHLGIYRKPTFTNVVIPQSSNHPASHKRAAFHYMLDRASKLPLTDIEKQKEITVIKTIAKNNGYTFHDIAKAYNRQKRVNKNKNLSTLCSYVQPKTKDEKVWAKFTYFDDRIRILTKIFKKSNIRVAFSVNNTIKKKCNDGSPVDKYSKSGVYSLRCLSCDQNYIGQTGRSFKIRYDEHIRDIRFNKEKSKYASHMLVLAPVRHH
jgi:hypothetical protein